MSSNSLIKGEAADMEEDENDGKDDDSVDLEFDEQLQHCLDSFDEDSNEYDFNDPDENVATPNNAEEPNEDSNNDYASDDSDKTVIIPVEKQYKNSSNSFLPAEKRSNSFDNSWSSPSSSENHLFSRRPPTTPTLSTFRDILGSNPTRHDSNLDEAYLERSKFANPSPSQKFCASTSNTLQVFNEKEKISQAECSKPNTAKKCVSTQEVQPNSHLTGKSQAQNSVETVNYQQKNVMDIARIVKKLLIAGKGNSQKSPERKIENPAILPKSSVNHESSANAVDIPCPSPPKNFDSKYSFIETIPLMIPKSTDRRESTVTATNRASDQIAEPSFVDSDGREKAADRLKIPNNDHKKTNELAVKSKKVKKNKQVERNTVIVPAVEEFCGTESNSDERESSEEKGEELSESDEEDIEGKEDNKAIGLPFASIDPENISIEIVHDLLQVLKQCKKCFSPVEFNALLSSQEPVLKQIIELQSTDEIALGMDSVKEINALLRYGRKCNNELKKKIKKKRIKEKDKDESDTTSRSKSRSSSKDSKLNTSKPTKSDSTVGDEALPKVRSHSDPKSVVTKTSNWAKKDEKSPIRRRSRRSSSSDFRSSRSSVSPRRPYRPHRRRYRTPSPKRRTHAHSKHYRSRSRSRSFSISPSRSRSRSRSHSPSRSSPRSSSRSIPHSRGRSFSISPPRRRSRSRSYSPRRGRSPGNRFRKRTYARSRSRSKTPPKYTSNRDYKKPLSPLGARDKPLPRLRSPKRRSPSPKKKVNGISSLESRKIARKNYEDAVNDLKKSIESNNVPQPAASISPNVISVPLNTNSSYLSGYSQFNMPVMPAVESQPIPFQPSNIVQTGEFEFRKPYPSINSFSNVQQSAVNISYVTNQVNIIQQDPMRQNLQRIFPNSELFESNRLPFVPSYDGPHESMQPQLEVQIQPEVQTHPGLQQQPPIFLPGPAEIPLPLQEGPPGCEPVIHFPPYQPVHMEAMLESNDVRPPAAPLLPLCAPPLPPPLSPPPAEYLDTLPETPVESPFQREQYFNTHLQLPQPVPPPVMPPRQPLPQPCENSQQLNNTPPGSDYYDPAFSNEPCDVNQDSINVSLKTENNNEISFEKPAETLKNDNGNSGVVHSGSRNKEAKSTAVTIQENPIKIKLLPKSAVDALDIEILEPPAKPPTTVITLDEEEEETQNQSGENLANDDGSPKFQRIRVKPLTMLQAPNLSSFTESSNSSSPSNAVPSMVEKSNSVANKLPDNSEVPLMNKTSDTLSQKLNCAPGVRINDRGKDNNSSSGSPENHSNLENVKNKDVLSKKSDIPNSKASESNSLTVANTEVRSSNSNDLKCNKIISNAKTSSPSPKSSSNDETSMTKSKEFLEKNFNPKSNSSGNKQTTKASDLSKTKQFSNTQINQKSNIYSKTNSFEFNRGRGRGAFNNQNSRNHFPNKPIMNNAISRNADGFKENRKEGVESKSPGLEKQSENRAPQKDIKQNNCSVDYSDPLKKVNNIQVLNKEIAKSQRKKVASPISKEQSGVLNKAIPNVLTSISNLPLGGDVNSIVGDESNKEQRMHYPTKDGQVIDPQELISKTCATINQISCSEISQIQCNLNKDQENLQMLASTEKPDCIDLPTEKVAKNFQESKGTEKNNEASEKLNIDSSKDKVEPSKLLKDAQISLNKEKDNQVTAEINLKKKQDGKVIFDSLKDKDSKQSKGSLINLNKKADNKVTNDSFKDNVENLKQSKDTEIGLKKKGDGKVIFDSAKDKIGNWKQSKDSLNLNKKEDNKVTADSLKDNVEDLKQSKDAAVGSIKKVNDKITDISQDKVKEGVDSKLSIDVQINLNKIAEKEANIHPSKDKVESSKGSKDAQINTNKKPDDKITAVLSKDKAEDLKQVKEAHTNVTQKKDEKVIVDSAKDKFESSKQSKDNLNYLKEPKSDTIEVKIESSKRSENIQVSTDKVANDEFKSYVSEKELKKTSKEKTENLKQVNDSENNLNTKTDSIPKTKVDSLKEKTDVHKQSKDGSINLNKKKKKKLKSKIDVSEINSTPKADDSLKAQTSKADACSNKSSKITSKNSSKAETCSEKLSSSNDEKNKVHNKSGVENKKHNEEKDKSNHSSTLSLSDDSLSAKSKKDKVPNSGKDNISSKISTDITNKKGSMQSGTSSNGKEDNSSGPMKKETSTSKPKPEKIIKKDSDELCDKQKSDKKEIKGPEKLSSKESTVKEPDQHQADCCEFTDKNEKKKYERYFTLYKCRKCFVKLERIQLKRNNLKQSSSLLKSNLKEVIGKKHYESGKSCAENLQKLSKKRDSCEEKFPYKCSLSQDSDSDRSSNKKYKPSPACKKNLHKHSNERTSKSKLSSYRIPKLSASGFKSKASPSIEESPVSPGWTHQESSSYGKKHLETQNCEDSDSFSGTDNLTEFKPRRKCFTEEEMDRIKMRSSSPLLEESQDSPSCTRKEKSSHGKKNVETEICVGSDSFSGTDNFTECKTSTRRKCFTEEEIEEIKMKEKSLISKSNSTKSDSTNGFSKKSTSAVSKSLSCAEESKSVKVSVSVPLSEEETKTEDSKKSSSKKDKLDPIEEISEDDKDESTNQISLMESNSFRGISLQERIKQQIEKKKRLRKQNSWKKLCEEKIRSLENKNLLLKARLVHYESMEQNAGKKVKKSPEKEAGVRNTTSGKNCSVSVTNDPSTSKSIKNKCPPSGENSSQKKLKTNEEQMPEEKERKPVSFMAKRGEKVWEFLKCQNNKKTVSTQTDGSKLDYKLCVTTFSSLVRPTEMNVSYIIKALESYDKS